MQSVARMKAPGRERERESSRKKEGGQERERRREKKRKKEREKGSGHFLREVTLGVSHRVFIFHFSDLGGVTLGRTHKPLVCIGNEKEIWVL